MPFETETLQLGETLPNGAIVIALRTAADMEGCTVLALTNGRAGDPYVTWYGSKVTREMVNGHYFDNIADAVADFNWR